MILLLSIDQHETTTELVMDWLEHLGVPYRRVNGDRTIEHFRDAVLNLQTLDGIPLAKVSAVWYIF